MTSDEFFPVPDDDLPAPEDDQPATGPDDLDSDRPAPDPEETALAAPSGEPAALEDAEAEEDDIAEPALPAPPRIVAEQPVGTEQPAPPADESVSAPGEPEPEPAAADAESPPVAETEAEAPEDISPADESVSAPDEPEPEPAAADAEPEPAPAPAEDAAPVAQAEPEAPEDISPAEPGPIRSRSTLVAPAPEAEPAESAEKAPMKDWDEDISPELAAILFAGAAAAAEAPARAEEAPADEEMPAPVEAAPRPTPAAGPITLIDVGDARRLPITAQGIASPAPDEQPAGKARYVRVEEPLGKENGQRISETWSYFKPDYPALDGRLVRRVHIEEHRYADGSWKWTFERQYTDRGRDTREVRANRDQTYIERHDRIARKDLSANKRVRVHEKAEMILAGQEHEEKRGFFSRLLGRGEKTVSGPAEWRPATSAEARSARGDGGQAFGGKLFGLF